jgi:hypothetical protein
MRNGCASARGLDGSVGNLRRRHWNGRVLAYGVARAGDGAGYYHVPVHDLHFVVRKKECSFLKKRTKKLLLLQAL